MPGSAANEAALEARRQYPMKADAYKILEEVGQGMSATVYKALCIPLNEVVAIKSLDLEKCSSSLGGGRGEVREVGK